MENGLILGVLSKSLAALKLLGLSRSASPIHSRRREQTRAPLPTPPPLRHAGGGQTEDGQIAALKEALKLRLQRPELNLRTERQTIWPFLRFGLNRAFIVRRGAVHCVGR